MLASTAVALLALALPAAVAPRSARPALLVLVHDDTLPPLGAGTLGAVIKEVHAIWDAYLDVDVAVGPDSRPTATGDVVTLVITDRSSSDDTREAGLGWIDFRDGEPANTIYVSPRRARLLGQRTVFAGRPLESWPRSVREGFIVNALGRSAAHEIGHYVLRSKEHPATGLMRAQFSTDDLLARTVTKFRLNDADVQRLRERFNSSYRLAGREPQAPPVQ